VGGHSTLSSSFLWIQKTINEDFLYRELTSCRQPHVSGHAHVDMFPSLSSHIFQNGDKICKADCFSSTCWSTGLCSSVWLGWKYKVNTSVICLTFGGTSTCQQLPVLSQGVLLLPSFFCQSQLAPGSTATTIRKPPHNCFS